MPIPPSTASSSTLPPYGNSDPNANPRYPDLSQYPITPDPETEERRYSAATALESFEMQVMHSSMFDESMARTRLRMMKIVAGISTEATQPPTSWAAGTERTQRVNEQAENNRGRGGQLPTAGDHLLAGVDGEEAGPSRGGLRGGTGGSTNTTGHAYANNSGSGGGGGGVEMFWNDDE